MWHYYYYIVTLCLYVHVLKTLLYVRACVGLNLPERMQSRRGQHRRPGCDSANKIKNTPPTINLAMFLTPVMSKKCVGCDCTSEPIQQASSWVESGHWCFGSLKDNGANWGRNQSQSDFLNLNCGGAERPGWQTAHPCRHFCAFCKSSESLRCLLPASSSIHCLTGDYGLHVSVLQPGLAVILHSKALFFCAVPSSSR